MTATRTTTTKTKRASVKLPVRRPVVIELEPEIIEAHPKVTVLDEATAAPRNRYGHLPDFGPGEVHARIIGSKLTFQPTDQGAARRVEALRAVAGRVYDHKRSENVYRLDQLRRHGASRLDEIALLATMHGLPLTFDADSTRRVERYRRELSRQLAPIPRVIWRDETEHGEVEVTAEHSLGHSTSWGGRDGHRIN